MMPLKQQAPIGGLGQAGMEYGKHESSGVAQFQQGVCVGCAFYEVITRKRGHVHGLCHFTGMRNPLPGQDGCSFLAGKWEAIDELLGLTWRGSANRLNVPILARPSSGLACSQDRQKAATNTAIHAYADKNGNKALHIGRAQRPHVREAAAASLRPGSVCTLPFCFNNPELSEV